MNILLVDDDEQIRKLLRTMMQMAGHRALAAANGVEALAVLRREPVDAIISDLMMPQMDGYRLCQAVRQDERFQQVPFIFHTTYTSPADEKLALDLGADAFLHKPANVDTILETLRRVTNQPRAVQPPPAATMPEPELMQKYSDRLVAKLEEKNTELAAAEAKFRNLVEQSLTGVYVIQDGRFVYVNPKLGDILGCSPAEITAAPLLDFVHEEDRPLVRENVRKRLYNEAGSIHYTLRMLHKSGRVIHVEAHGGRAEYEGRPAILGTLLDITERQQAEAALSRSELRFRSVWEHSVDGLRLLDAEGKIVVVNEAYCRLVGMRREEMVGQPYTITYGGAHNASEMMQKFHARFARRTVPEREVRHMTFRNQREADLEVTGSFLELPDGATLLLSLFRDVTEHRQAEAALRASEERLRTIIATEPECVKIVSPEGRALEMNPAGLRMLEADSPDQVCGHMIVDVVAPEHRAAFSQLHEQVMQGGSGALEFEVIGFKGTRRWLDTRAVPLRDASGTVTALLGITHDITEGKRSEAALRQSEARFAKAFQANPAAMCITTVKDGRFIEVNERYCRLFGYPREALLGRTAVKLALWADPASRAFAVEQLQAHGFFHDYETRFRRSNGDAIDALISMELIAFPGEPEPVIVSMFADITERLKAEQKVREQAALLDLTTDAIIVRDLTHRITYWNQGAESLYGWTKEEAVGQVATKLYATIHWEGRDAARRQVLEQGTWQGELRQKNKAGQELVVQSRWTLLRNGDGTPQAVLIINSDITKQKQLEEQFLRAQRMESIGSLASGIAHDLNNALAPVLMASEFLKMTCTDAETNRVLDTIQASAKRGAGMVKQILTFARGSEGERGVVQPRHLVKEMIDITRQTFPKAIQIRTDIANETWTLLGNPTQLHQILLNLCVNARDAMPIGGTLTLAAANVRLDATEAAMSPDAQPGSYVLLSVTDTGSGMPPEVKARIFDAFFTTKASDKGTGLGLSTVRNIVKDHGGFLTVDSEMGLGTTFKVYLPAQETTIATALAAAPPALPMGHGELILVVDDEAAIRSIATQTLRMFGYRVVTANDGAQAVAVCAQQLSDLQMVIMDMSMPIMGGPAAIRAIRVLAPRLKVVVASGSDSSPLPQELDVHSFLRKPFSADDLINTVHEVLRGG